MRQQKRLKQRKVKKSDIYKINPPTGGFILYGTLPHTPLKPFFVKKGLRIPKNFGRGYRHKCLT